MRSDQCCCCCVQLPSHVQLLVTIWTASWQASLFLTIFQSLPKFMSIELVMPSNHLILCHPLLILAPIFASIRVFSSETAIPMRWPKYWSFSFGISPSKEYSRLISFKTDWFDLLGFQGSLKHHSSKTSILQCSAFFIASSHICTWLLERPLPWLYRPLSAKWCLCFLNHCLDLS